MQDDEQALFSHYQEALKHTEQTCPECGAPLAIRSGKRGLFLGCTHYPDCHFSRPLHPTDSSIKQVMEGTQCPDCGQPLAIKQGRFGLFVGCTGFPECHHTEQIDEPADTGVRCPKCQQGELIERVNRYGKTFYSCNRYPDCRFVVNGRPHRQSCPECGSAILIERKTRKGVALVCPEEGCSYHTQPV